jgi:beta-lactamase class C
VKDSTIVFMRGFGVKEIGTTDSVDVNTVFRIASVSKCFASFLTGTLVEEKKISFDDRISRYVPQFKLISPDQTNKLTVRHVLSHTTGLPFHAYTNLVEEGLPLDEMLRRLEGVPLASKVGEAYSYQNVAYSLVGEAIKSATGKSYEAWMIENVFNPLGMKNASIDYFSMMTNKNKAMPHMPKKGGWRKVKINNTYYNVAPAGGVNASIADMAQWMIALLGNRPDVIKPETLEALYKPAIKAPSKNRNYGRMNRVNDSYYGLGWRILHFPDDTLVYHGGFVNGYRSEVAVNQKDKIAICILANAPGELPDNGIPIFFNVLKQYRDQMRSWDEEKRKFLRDSLSLQ